MGGLFGRPVGVAVEESEVEAEVEVVEEHPAREKDWVEGLASGDESERPHPPMARLICAEGVVNTECSHR